MARRPKPLIDCFVKFSTVKQSFPATRGKRRTGIAQLSTSEFTPRLALGHVAVAAARFDVCAQCIGLDEDERNVKNSIRLAFEQKKAFEKCHFFHIDDLAADPRILLDNPHFVGEKLNEADVVLLHAPPTTIERLVPLLARMSTKKVERTFVTLTNHIPDEFAVNPQIVEGTELCSYDGVVDNRAPAPPTTRGTS